MSCPDNAGFGTCRLDTTRKEYDDPFA